MGSLERRPADVIIVLDSEDEDEQSQAADLSPGFRNAAAMAGWDDEALLAACDGEVAATPDKESCERGERKRDARTPGQAITPASLNRVHRKPRRPLHVNLEGLTIHETGDRVNNVQKEIDKEGESLNVKKEDAREGTSQQEGNSSGKSGKEENGDAKLDQLRDELSCAVCLDVCFEPSTTSCGHSFCRCCLQSAVSKCGLRCPKCRQLIKEQGAINVVLWNTIQILFPDETAKRSQAKKADDEEKASLAAQSRRSQSSRQLPVDRSRPIGSFRRLAAPFRAPARDRDRYRSSGSGGSGGSSDRGATFIDLEARRQQEELDAIVASRLQDEELRSSSGYSELARFHRRLRHARATAQSIVE